MIIKPKQNMERRHGKMQQDIMIEMMEKLFEKDM